MSACLSVSHKKKLIIFFFSQIIPSLNQTQELHPPTTFSIFLDLSFKFFYLYFLRKFEIEKTNQLISLFIFLSFSLFFSYKNVQIRKEFFELLRENDIDRHQRWSDVKKKIDDKDSRYKAVGDSITREDYFHDYCKMLKDEKKKRVSV